MLDAYSYPHKITLRMPGTIQVSVLDFKGLTSSSKVSIKVSKGKLEYQTWDKGEFSFPVTTLRDNLIITIQDAEGTEISHTGVETRLVVEKGVWDEIFSFEGGGHVHMKLKFVLNEDERQRIRIMRESALKKKQEELCRGGHGSYINASISNSEVSGSQESSLKGGLLANEASQVSVSLNNLKDAKFDIDMEKKHGSSENASISNSEVSGSQESSHQSGLLANEASQVYVSLNNLKDTKSDIDMNKKHDEHCNSGHGSPRNASVSNSEVSGSQENSLQSGLLANEASQVYVPLNNLKDAKFDTDKKKKDEDSGHGSPEDASVSNSKVSGSQESSLQNGLLDNETSQVSVPLNKNKDAKFDIDNRDTIYSMQKQKRTDLVSSVLDKRNQDSVPPELEKRDQDSVLSELEKRKDSKKAGPAGKAHSKVKNMISAFEGSVYQDVRPPIKPPPKISQMRKTGSDSSLVNSYLKEVETEKIIPPKVTLGTINREKVKTFGSVEPIYGVASSKKTVEPISVASSPKETVEPTYGAALSKETEQLKDRFKVKERESVVKEEKKHSKDFERASTMEKSVFPQRMLDKYSKGKQSWNLFSAKHHPRRKSITKEGGEEIFRNDPREAEGNSNGKLEPVAIWSDDHCSIGSSGLWIFPGEVKGSCITTGSKQIFDLTGGLWDETNTNQIKLSACDPKNTGEVNDADAGTAIVSNEDGKTSSEKLRPRVETSMDPEESSGPFGQVIKVVIIVGFATLVLLTGKRTYR